MTLKVDIIHKFKGFTLNAAFEAGPGITALFGRSGAGKTTIINAIAGLLHPDCGTIQIGSHTFFDSAHKVHLPPHKRRIGYVFQDARLFPHLTVAENLIFGMRYAKGAPLSTNLDEITERLGLTRLMHRRPTALSGGEKQRVALARALLCQPQLLLMDEPLASLDNTRKLEILPYLERLRDHSTGVPIIYVSHAVDEIARLADDIVLLKDGHVAAHGPVFDVMSDPSTMPLIGVREAGAVLEATVTHHAPDGLSQLTLASGASLELPGVAAHQGAKVRLRVLAQDVILSLDKPDGLSSVNILPVTINAIQPGDGPGAAVTLTAGSDRLLARITARAIGDLRLMPGMHCYAIIKATTVAPGSIGR